MSASDVPSDWAIRHTVASAEYSLESCTASALPVQSSSLIRASPSAPLKVSLTCVSTALAGSVPAGVPAGLLAPCEKRMALFASNTAIPPPLTTSLQGAVP